MVYTTSLFGKVSTGQDYGLHVLGISTILPTTKYGHSDPTKIRRYLLYIREWLLFLFIDIVRLFKKSSTC